MWLDYLGNPPYPVTVEFVKVDFWRIDSFIPSGGGGLYEFRIKSAR